MSVRKKWHSSELSVRRIYMGESMDRYEVTLLKGVWPPDEELIALCDGMPVGHQFGGSVEALENNVGADMRLVTVHTD